MTASREIAAVGGTRMMHSPADILGHAARDFGDKTALITAGGTFSYRQLDQMSTAVAHALREYGIHPGDTVSLYSANSWEWVVAYHGVLKAGAVVNPVNAMLTGQELAYVLRDCGAAAIFASAEHAASVSRLATDIPHLSAVISFGATQPGSIAFDQLLRLGSHESCCTSADPASSVAICYTSGTTGHPKGAVQSHRAVLLNCALTATMHQRCENDIVVTALPCAHVYGNVAVNSTFLTGGTVVLMERFDPAAALHAIGEHRATMFEGVPAMYAMMLADQALGGVDLTSLRCCTVGGQTLPLATLERWESVSGARLIELWGMTEIAGLGLTHALHAPPMPGSVGVSLPGTEIRVADTNDTHNDAPRGSPGELMVRGPLVMLGYHNDPTATAEAIDSDGWLHTGDIATMDETGHVTIVDRRKDMIITGGYNVYPAEIERVLAGHPDIAQVAVGPVPDPVKGELACAYVVPIPTSTITDADVLDYARARLAAYKRPRLVRFVDTLPTTSSGKVMRRRLAELSTGQS